MGAQAKALGRGGIAKVARLLEVNPSTVSRGLLELGFDVQFQQRVRRPGAGRKRLTVSDPGLMEALMGLVKPVGGRLDQPTPLQWTTLSTRSLATELTSQGHRISAWTVANLLSEAGFSIRASPGRLAPAKRSGHDAQFDQINRQVTAHLGAGQPVVVVSFGKREPAENGEAGKDTPARDRKNAHGDETKGPLDGGNGERRNGTRSVARSAARSPDQWVRVQPDWHTVRFALATLRAWGMQLWSSRHDVHRLLLVEEHSAPVAAGGHLLTSELSGLQAETSLRINQYRLPPGIVRWNKIEHQASLDCSVLHPDGHLTRHSVNLKLIVNA
jgi:hypothetical protein